MMIRNLFQGLLCAYSSNPSVIFGNNMTAQLKITKLLQVVQIKAQAQGNYAIINLRARHSVGIQEEQVLQYAGFFTERKLRGI